APGWTCSASLMAPEHSAFPVPRHAGARLGAARFRSEDAHRGLQAAASDSDAGVRQAAAVALKRWEQRAGAN
ncbi:MAG TPA: hypothetical protein VEL05_13030, partial [Candidatus Acidoferrum sp.]|nr:hypothetical protein [Candidatus Acidoferrum sp.]